MRQSIQKYLGRFHLLMTPGRCLFAAAVFFLLMVGIGALPGKASAAAEMVPDKLLHFVAYAILSCLVYYGLSGSRTWRAFALSF